MPHPRRFRFAVQLDEPFPGRTWADTAQEVEQLGYSTIFLPDHLDEGHGPIAVMAACAAVTSVINVGVLVFDCDFRHPAFLAKELATIDHIAEGRLEAGIGAGWKTTDYERSGLAMDRPGVRVSRMMEHAAVLRGLWSDGPFSFAGEHYTITELEGLPAPYTPGGPKLLVGGGAPRLLRWAGANADIVGVNASIHSGEIDQAAAEDALSERIDEKVGWLKKGAGDRFDDLELNAWLAAAELTDDPAVTEMVAAFFGTEPAALRSSPLALIGTPDQVAEMLEERRSRWGYSYHCLPGDKAVAFAPIVAELTGR